MLARSCIIKKYHTQGYFRYYKPGVQSFKIPKYAKCVMNIFNMCLNTSNLNQMLRKLFGLGNRVSSEQCRTFYSGRPCGICRSLTIDRIVR